MEIVFSMIALDAGKFCSLWREFGVLLAFLSRIAKNAAAFADRRNAVSSIAAQHTKKELPKTNFCFAISLWFI